MLDWRRLLADLRVEYIDRGKNCSRGNINIACPFCEDDPSFHLSLSETKPAYYCYRMPKRHSGENINRVLIKLGIDYADVVDVLNSYSSDRPIVPKQRKSAAGNASRWDRRFLPAAEDPRYTNYLLGRGFPTPVSTCRLYDLRYAPEGTWAQRLLLPIRQDGEVLTWVGRAISSQLSPKYLAEQIDQPFVYAPRHVRDNVILVEGPIDALKIAVATDGRPISSLAILGIGFSAEKILLIDKLIKDASSFHVALDSSVNIMDAYEFINELTAMTRRPVSRLELPYGAKDPGELTIDEVNDWLELL